MLGLVACSSDRLSNSGGGGGPQQPDSCATPTEGCACDATEPVECGVEKERIGDYVSCAHGQRVCEPSGKWGTCVESGTTMQFHSSGSMSLMGLGSSSTCASNPCDPYCSNFIDTPTDLDAGADSAITFNDGGLSLAGKPATGVNSACTSIEITPTAATITVTSIPTSGNFTPLTTPFTAQLLPAGCYPGTPTFLWSTSRYDISSMSSTGTLSLVSPVAGPITVTVYAGNLSAAANVDVVIKAVDTSEAPSGVTPASFPSATTTFTDDMKVLYPYNNTVFPLGMLSPILQWQHAGAVGNASGVKVSLRYPATSPTFSWEKIQKEETTVFDPTIPASTPNTTLTAQPRAFIPQSVWRAFDQAAKGGIGTIAFQRIVGGNVYSEVTVPINFATGQLKGSVYYNSYGTNLVKNYNSTYNGASFGAATLGIRPGATTPIVVAGKDTTNDGCRVCHSVAANGSILSTETGNHYGVVMTDLTQTFQGGTLYDVNQTSSDYWSFPGIAPDGKTAINASSNSSFLYSLAAGTRGATITTTGLPSGFGAEFPSFSFEGKRVAFNWWGGTSGGVTGDHRDLAVMDFDPTTKAFSNIRRIENVSSPTTDTWPTFLPGGDSVLYQKDLIDSVSYSGKTVGSGVGYTRSGCDTRDNACNNMGKTAEIWWAQATGTAAPTRMNNLNGLDSAGALTIPVVTTGAGTDADPKTFHNPTYEGKLNYEPTVLPVEAGGYYWTVFTSRRLFGNVATINPWWSDPRWKNISQEPTTKKLWVSAVKKGAAGGTDPSAPAFYLPGQEYFAGNSRGYWVLDACKTPSTSPTAANLCETDLDCCGAPATARCNLDSPLTNPPTRHCVPVSASACVPTNSTTLTCSTSAECCDFATGAQCISGFCKIPPPVDLYVEGTFERDFAASCGKGTRPVWQLFEWQATVPTGTKITFKARTGDTSAEVLAASPVGVGIANPPGSAAWTNAGFTVDSALKAVGQVSKQQLRVSFTLTPSADRVYTPSLQTWRLLYDCIPSD